jgi:type I restriction enzyme M protein
LPKYKFKWSNLPGYLVRGLCTDLGLDPADPSESLRAAFGVRPSEEFVRVAWPSLLERWLTRDSEARQGVTMQLWDSGLGPDECPRGKAAELAFLRARNNSKGLRRAVWATLVSSGEMQRDEAELPGQVDRGSLVEVQPSPKAAGQSLSAATVSVAQPVVPVNRRTDSLTLQELESRLWAAANALRGPVDPADFKTYVFPMLFWKWISDTWAFERAQAVAEFGEDVPAEVEADFHRFDLPPSASWRVVTTKTDNIGVRVQQALGRIEQANPSTLAGIFGDAAWGNKERLPETALVNLIYAFDGLTLDPGHVTGDMLGQAYEYLLKNFADVSGQKAGEFFTPRSVVHLLVGILDPKPGERVYDPAAGSGGMLVATINRVRDAGGEHRSLRLYAQEINLTTSAIARMNLFLHEIEDFKVIRGDTLRNPGFRKPDGALDTFDVVIANPPFSLQNWGADMWPADPRSFCGVPPAKNADYAWVQHMITSMNPGTGRMGVVMPHGVLFRGGAEGRIRQCLIEQDRLEAVIGLPPNLFYSTGLPACLLIFRAVKPNERRNHVLFVDASARFAKGRNQNTLTETDVEDVFSAYRIGEDPDGPACMEVRLVPVDEIKANGFDLNISRYVKADATETTDLPTAIAEYQAARAARRAAEERMLAVLTAAGIEISDE